MKIYYLKFFLLFLMINQVMSNDCQNINLNRQLPEIKNKLQLIYEQGNSQSNTGLLKKEKKNESGLGRLFHFMEKISLPNTNIIDFKVKDKMLSGDTLFIGIPPNDSLIITNDFKHTGPIILVLNGKLVFKNTKADIYGDIFLLHNSRLEVINSTINMPQQYFYQRSIMLTGSSVFEVRNSVFDFGSLSHNLIVTDSAFADIRGITNKGFTTTGMYSKGKISIDSSNECGEFILDKEVQLDIKNSSTALLWHHVGKGESFDVDFPEGDTVKLYESNPSTPGVSGMKYKVKVENTSNVMWALMPENGAHLNISDSKIRAIGLWTKGNFKSELNGLVNNSFYSDFSVSNPEFDINIKKSSVETWSIYTYDNSDFSIKGSIFGELGAMGSSKVICSKVFCDGSGGYLWGTDTAFTIFGFSSATTSVRSQGNGIFVFAYSTLAMGQAMAVGNSILMTVQSTIPEQPIPYDNSAVWNLNIESPSQAGEHSKIAIIGSAWINKTKTSYLSPFGKYQLFIKPPESIDWINCITADSPKYHDTLCVLNALSYPRGIYQLKLVLFDSLGNSMEALKSISLLPSDLGVEEKHMIESFVFPNPAINTIDVKLNKNNEFYSWCITDLLGNELMKGAIPSSEFSININNLDKGIYFIRIKGKNSVITNNMVKM